MSNERDDLRNAAWGMLAATGVSPRNTAPDAGTVAAVAQAAYCAEYAEAPKDAACYAERAWRESAGAWETLAREAMLEARRAAAWAAHWRRVGRLAEALQTWRETGHGAWRVRRLVGGGVSLTPDGAAFLIHGETVWSEETAAARLLPLKMP